MPEHRAKKKITHKHDLFVCDFLHQPLFFAMCMYVLLSGVPQPSGYLMGDLHDALSDFGNFFIRNLNGAAAGTGGKQRS